MPIIAEKLTHIYMPNTPSETVALRDVDLRIEDGELFAIIGHTGSGKSTLIQHFNALLKPTSGTVYLDDMDVFAEKANYKKARSQVGLVFQYPEYQLFEETVFKDIAFGPRNMGVSEAELETRVREAMAYMGLDFDKYQSKSPFELSGGQKRRVAIAGVLAMRPRVLILDEPMAGLDPKGRVRVLELIHTLQAQSGCTVVMISHSMEDVSVAAQRILVMNEGGVYRIGTPEEIFADADALRAIGLNAPAGANLAHTLRKSGVDVPQNLFKNADVLEFVRERLSQKGANA